MASNNDSQPGYIRDIEDDIEARKEWAHRDTEIQKRRLGERKAKNNKPYPNAPNFVVQIIDDATREKTDQEITMILNAPRIAYFIPTDPDMPQELRQSVENAFDTYLRHVIKYRQKKDEAVDCKNARGFAVTKVIRTEHPKWGTIPDFETTDLKDVIVSPDLKASDIADAERATAVLKFSKKKLKDRIKQGWNKKAVGELLSRIKTNNGDDRSEKGMNSTYFDEENSSIRATERLVGINVSDYANDNIVVWEIMHYAIDWDLKHDKKKRVKKGKKCISYICPDEADLLLNIKPWKERDTLEQLDQRQTVLNNIKALEDSDSSPVEVLEDGSRVIRIEGDDRPWPLIQHRYEWRTRWWYDTRGIGHICRDNQIAATGVMNAKMTWLDYSKNLMFEQDPASPDNQQNVKIKLGGTLPRGTKIAAIPQPPSNFDFEIDSQRRDASQKAGTSGSQFSAQVSETRKLQKTATESNNEMAHQGVVSSASVDRFNDPDAELFGQLWDDLKRLQVKLPIIAEGDFAGFIDPRAYEFDFVIVPAASAKTLNPDLQFMKDREAVSWAAGFKDLIAVDIQPGVSHALARHDPNLSQMMMIDPNEAGPQAQPPIYKIIAELTQMIQKLGQHSQQQDKEIEASLKLSAENDDKIEEIHGAQATV